MVVVGLLRLVRVEMGFEIVWDWFLFAVGKIGDMI